MRSHRLGTWRRARSGFGISADGKQGLVRRPLCVALHPLMERPAPLGADGRSVQGVRAAGSTAAHCESRR